MKGPAPGLPDGDGRRPLPRNSFGLMTDRQFGTIFWGMMLSTVGVWIHSIVAAIVVYSSTGSALWVGLVSVAQFAPQMMSPLSGKRADKGNLGQQLVVGRVLCVAGSGSLVLWFSVFGEPVDESGALAVLAASAVTGLGFVIGGPAQQAIIPLVIRPGELGIAMGLNSLPMTFARVVGPVAGAGLMAYGGATLAFGVATLAHLIFVSMLLLASLPAGVKRIAGADLSVSHAVGYLREHGELVILLVIVAVAGIASEPAVTLAPAFAHEFGGSTALVGQLTAGFGLGAAVGYIIYICLGARLAQARIAQVGLAHLAAGGTGLALAWSPVPALVAYAVMGIGFMLTLTPATTLIQQKAPPALRGRIMSFWFMSFIGSRPLAAFGDGWLADTFSLAAAMMVTVLIVVVVMLVFRPNAMAVSENGTEERRCDVGL